MTAIAILAAFIAAPWAWLAIDSWVLDAIERDGAE
jgi:hypothetical protein